MKVIVLGGSGQVGEELKRIYPQALYPTRQQADLVNKASLDHYLSREKPDLLINCAAYTLVDKAETESELCSLINAKSLEWMSAHARKIIHFSTDYVFNGRGCRPYSEDDQRDPVNAYGKSKADGEDILLKACPGAVIIRTSWVYSDLGKNFVKTMNQLSKQRDELRVVADQIGSPTYAADLAKLIHKHAIESWNFQPGVYHYSNEGVASWYDFAVEIMRIKQSHCKVIPISTEEYPTPAKRPFYSVLSKRKIKSELNISIPHWKTSLEECLQKIP